LRVSNFEIFSVILHSRYVFLLQNPLSIMICNPITWDL